LDGLRLVLDCGFGAAYYIGPALFARLGAEVFALNAEPDGARINVRCGSTHPEQLQAAVKERRADLGGLRAALAVLAALPDDASWADVARAHYGIHGAIVDAAGSTRLTSAYAALRTELLFFVTCIRPYYSVRGLTSDHTRLVEAIESRDPARASEALALDLAGGHASLRAAAPR
jgi:DNA-binding GntR family transcriptional regulator